MRKIQEPVDLETIAKSMPDYLNNGVLETKICVIDSLLNGGIEIGAFAQLVGESGTGKSTITLLMAKELCEQGKNVVYLDTENSISKEMIISIGLDEFMKGECYRFFYYRLSTFTEVEEKLDQIILTGSISLVIVDSLPRIT